VRVGRLLAGITPQLVRDLLLLSGGQFVSKLIGLLVFAYLARTLAPEGYGAVEYVVGLTVFFAMAVEGGLGTVGVRRLGLARGEMPRLARQIPLARLTVAAIAVPAMIVVMAWVGPETVPRMLVVLFAASLLFAAFNQEWLLQGTERMTHVAVAQIVRMLVFGAVVVAVVRNPDDLAGVGWAEFAAVAVTSVYYFVVQRALLQGRRQPGGDLLRGAVALAREAAPLGLSNFVWAAAQYMPLFLVGSIVGGAQVGWFAAAQRLVNSVATFSYVYHFNLYPSLVRAAARDGDAAARLMTASFRVMAWLSVGAALGVTLAATPVLVLVFGAQFAAAAAALGVLVWVIPVTLLSGHARGLLVVAGVQRHVLVAQIAGLATTVLGGFAFVAMLGDTGAAAAAVAGAVGVWLVAHGYARRERTPPPALVLALLPALLALLAGVAASFLPVAPLWQAILACALYGVLAPLLDRRLIADVIELAHAKARFASTGLD
jgi:O-antigen/teichoic acid export membrane protein